MKQQPETELYFVGTVGGFERPLLEQAEVKFAAWDEVQSGPFHGVNPARILVSTVKLIVGTGQAFRLLRKRKPQVILSTGGWVSLPVALAAWVRRIPLVVFLPDIEPGLAIRVLRRFAERVAITVPESARYFRSGQTVVTGYPLRAAMLAATREKAIEHFQLDPARPTVLVFGGSRGSRAINIALGNGLPELLNGGIQVIHITGTLDWERMQKQVQAFTGRKEYHASAYLHEMGPAMAAADLVVCRAGASILGEFPFFRLPSILIPLAYSWRYQEVNADYLTSRDAAVRLAEADLESELLPTIRRLLADPERLEQMRSNAGKLAQPDGAKNLAQLLLELAQRKI